MKNGNLKCEIFIGGGSAIVLPTLSRDGDYGTPKNFKKITSTAPVIN